MKPRNDQTSDRGNRLCSTLCRRMTHRVSVETQLADQEVASCPSRPIFITCSKNGANTNYSPTMRNLAGSPRISGRFARAGFPAITRNIAVMQRDVSSRESAHPRRVALQAPIPPAQKAPCAPPGNQPSPKDARCHRQRSRCAHRAPLSGVVLVRSRRVLPRSLAPSQNPISH
jgi:hypothetical protein